MTALARIIRTTAFKLAVIYLSVLTLASGSLFFYVSQNLADDMRAQVVEIVDAELSGLSDQYRAGGIRRLVSVVDARSRRPGASLYLVVDFSGNILAGNIEDLPQVALQESFGKLQRVGYTRRDDQGSYEALVRVFALPGGFHVLVGRDLAEQKYFRDILGQAFRLWLFVLVLLGGVTWIFISRKVLRRIDAIAATGRSIMLGDLSERLSVDGGGDEFDRLAISLNHMLERIEALMAGVKNVSDNIAHDLKTPLTRMRNRVEAALREGTSGAESQNILETVIEDCDQLIKIFDALLKIARLEAGSSEAAFVELDVGELAAEVVELYEPAAEEEGVTLSLSLAASSLEADRSVETQAQSDKKIKTRANRELLVQALVNLIENALKYGKPIDGAAPVITVAVEASCDKVCLSVADNGAGVAPSDRQQVFERFVRLDASRSESGSGLGLSLVQAVMGLHGGKVVLEDANPGLKAILQLPRRACEDV